MKTETENQQTSNFRHFNTVFPLLQGLCLHIQELSIRNEGLSSLFRVYNNYGTSYLSIRLQTGKMIAEKGEVSNLLEGRHFGIK